MLQEATPGRGARRSEDLIRGRGAREAGGARGAAAPCTSSGWLDAHSSRASAEPVQGARESSVGGFTRASFPGMRRGASGAGLQAGRNFHTTGLPGHLLLQSPRPWRYQHVIGFLNGETGPPRRERGAAPAQPSPIRRLSPDCSVRSSFTVLFLRSYRENAGWLARRESADVSRGVLEVGAGAAGNRGSWGPLRGGSAQGRAALTAEPSRPRALSSAIFQMPPLLAG